jgi:hypothetical protein
LDLAQEGMVCQVRLSEIMAIVQMQTATAVATEGASGTAGDDEGEAETATVQ